MTNYPGFCMKYGGYRVSRTVWSAPAIFNAATQVGLGTALGTSTGWIAGLAIGTTAAILPVGYAGYCSAGRAHERLNISLSRQGVGLEGGGRTVRKAQARAYANVVVPFLVGSAAFGVAAGGISSIDSEAEPEQQNNSTINNTSVVDVVHPMKQKTEHVSDPAEYQLVSYDDLITLSV